MSTPIPDKTDEFGIWLEPRRTLVFLGLMCAMPFLFVYALCLQDYSPKGYQRP